MSPRPQLAKASPSAPPPPSAAAFESALLGSAAADEAGRGGLDSSMAAAEGEGLAATAGARDAPERRQGAEQQEAEAAVEGRGEEADPFVDASPFQLTSEPHTGPSSTPAGGGDGAPAAAGLSLWGSAGRRSVPGTPRAERVPTLTRRVRAELEVKGLHQEGSNLVFLSARPESYKVGGVWVAVMVIRVGGWVGGWVGARSEGPAVGLPTAVPELAYSPRWEAALSRHMNGCLSWLHAACHCCSPAAGPDRVGSL